MKLAHVLCLIVMILLSTYSFGAQCAENGMELDALPFATGGYYASFWHAVDGWRIRGVISHVNIPDFSIKNGFENARNDAYALILDRFFGDNAKFHQGLWAGAGIEYWRNSIERSGYSGHSTYNEFVLTAGAGYVWNITDRLFINPWFAAHLIPDSPGTVEVSGADYDPETFLAEASLKLGWRF